jgi:hypothetical protein
MSEVPLHIPGVLVLMKVSVSARGLARVAPVPTKGFEAFEGTSSLIPRRRCVVIDWHGRI